MKGVSRASGSPTKFLQSMVNGIIAHVHWAIEPRRETLCHSHSVESQRRIKAPPRKVRVNRGKIVVSNVERMSGFQRRRLFPYSVPCNGTLDLSDEDPICPASKRGTHPFVINSCPNAGRHCWI